jgi:hypothetical protein
MWCADRLVVGDKRCSDRFEAGARPTSWPDGSASERRKGRLLASSRWRLNRHDLSMARLSPRQVDDLVVRICGGSGDAFEYRTANQLHQFFDFAEADTSEAGDGSRASVTQNVVGSANRTTLGTSGLPEGIEKIVKSLLDPREFADATQHADAVDDVAELLRPAGALAEFRDPDVVLRSTRVSRGQRVLEEQVHTVFGKTLDDEAFTAARTHYRKAKRYASGSEADYENACKESMCAIESMVLTLTGGSDLVKALRRLAQEDRIPKPIAEMVIKLYAYRGDEPGIAHAGPVPPDVGQAEAELLVNLAGSIGVYMRAKLSSESEVVAT